MGSNRRLDTKDTLVDKAYPAKHTALMKIKIRAGIEHRGSSRLYRLVVIGDSRGQTVLGGNWLL